MLITRALTRAAIAATVSVAMTLMAPASDGGTVLHVDDDAPLGGSGLTWETAYKFLQDALANAVAGTEIRVGQGTYQPDQDEGDNVTPGDREATLQLINGVALMGGFAGIGAPNPDDRDIQIYETILSGDLLGDDGPDFVNNGENSFHVLTSIEIDDTALLDGVTIRGGNANGEPASPPPPLPSAVSGPEVGFLLLPAPAAGATTGLSLFSGGGLFNVDGSPTLLDCTFEANFAEALGGGMATDGAGIPTLDGCTFIDNRAGIDSPANGGGLSVRGAGGGITVLNCEFLSNIATNVGGAIEIVGFDGPLTVTIADCTFFANQVTGPSLGASGGAAIVVFDNDPVIANCNFILNDAVDTKPAFARGGAIAFSGEFQPIVIDCVFFANTAVDWGGAITTQSSSQHAVFNCTFTDNSAGPGGGSPIFQGGGAIGDAGHGGFTNCLFAGNVATQGGAVSFGNLATFTNCTFTDNTAEVGGGMYNDGCSPSVINCTFSENTAFLEGGGMYSTGTSNPIVANCTLWGDSPDEIALVFPAVTKVSYSNVEGGWVGGNGNIDADPLFVDPGNGDFRLSPGSPCIDAGDNMAVPKGIDTDFDGNPRFADDLTTTDTGNGDCPIVDMGAYELPTTCPWDLDCDGSVATADLLALLGAWGMDPGGPPDFNGDGNVSTADLSKLLGAWGPCPK